MKQKTKEYKRFNFPNDLTALEQYYYYLLEFGAIPKKIPAELIENIFKAMVKDYLEGFIDIETYECIVGNLYYNFVVSNQIDINSQIDNLMEESSDVTFYGEKPIKELTEKLKKHFS